MSEHDVTQLLQRARDGDRSALDVLLPGLYAELHRLAEQHMRAEREAHTLGPTALVHEAYFKLVDQTRVDWQGRAHFLAVASTVMRRVLVDHARARRRAKRGGPDPVLALDEVLEPADPRSEIDLVALDDLLEELARFDERGARVVECRVFGGLTIEETAVALDSSPMTVKRAWRLAKTWLRQELEGPA